MEHKNSLSHIFSILFSGYCEGCKDIKFSDNFSDEENY
jgi:hypothetical protein